VSNQYPDARPVAYAPALGRATQLAGELVNGWAHSKRNLDQQSATILHDALGDSRWAVIQPLLDVTSPSEVPLLGYWFIRNLPRKVCFDDIFERIAELRSHENVSTCKNYLLSPESDAYGVRQLGQRLRRELKLPRESLKGKVSVRFQVILYPAIKLFVQKDLDQELIHAPIPELVDRLTRRFRYRALRSQTATVLMRMLPDSRDFAELDSRLIDCVKSLNGTNAS